MPVQTVYTKTMKKGTPGLILWDFGTADLTSAIAEGVIPFGYAVIQGSKARTAIVGNVKVIGFATRSLMSVYAINNFVDSFGPQEPVPVMRSGYFWGINAGLAAVADGSAVYANAAGAVCDSTAAGALVVPGCRFEIGGAIGALVLVRVDIITV